MYKHCPIIVAVNGFLILILGIVCTWYGFPTLVEHQINQNIILREGSQAFDMWKKQPFPLFYKIYFFDVQNTEEVMLGKKPILKEKGPYVYDLHIERQIIEIDEDADTIKYHLKKHFVFNATASGCCSDDDVVTIVNAALVGTVLKVNSMLPGLIDMVIKGMPYIYPNITDLFLRVKVKDILFDGITLYCSAPEIASICSIMKGARPSTMKIAANDKDLIFSMMSAYNDTLQGPLTMTRGIKNTTRGDLVKYRFHKMLDDWEKDPPYCNRLNGSDSGLYFPMKKPVPIMYTFVPEICRSVASFFERKMIKSGLEVYKYASTEESLSTAGPYQCFCAPDENDTYLCPPKGVINLEPCLMAPVLMSNPHFYLGDKKLLDYAGSLKPVKEKHESYLILEPRTATPLEGAKRTQMNIEIKQYDNFPLLENVTGGIFPILWLEEGVELPENLVHLLQTSFDQIALLDTIQWILIATGIALMIISFVLVMYQEKLMCFSTSGSVKVTEPGLFTTRTSNLNFNTSVVYPKHDNPAFVNNEDLDRDKRHYSNNRLS